MYSGFDWLNKLFRRSKVIIINRPISQYKDLLFQVALTILPIMRKRNI